jgi:hypothetical protein
MSRLKLMSLLLTASWFLPASLPAATGSRAPLWQEGEILSRKTILPGHHHPRTRYIYRIKGGGVQYMARFDQPLSLSVYAPLKFSVNRNHLFVQDSDGSEMKASILQKSEPVIRH